MPKILRPHATKGPRAIRAGQIFAFREDRALTQVELAEELGVTPRTIQRWENYQLTPPLMLDLALDGLDLRRTMPEVITVIRKVATEHP